MSAVNLAASSKDSPNVASSAAAAATAAATTTATATASGGVSLDTFAAENGLSGLQDAEVSKLRQIVSRRRKKFTVEVIAVMCMMLLCWLIGYARVSIAWVLMIGFASVFRLHRRVSSLIDDSAYLTYRWYSKRRALRTAESAEWLNALIKQWLVFSEGQFSAMLKRKLDSKFEKMAKKTKVLESMSLKSLTFGKQPPYFVGMRVLNDDSKKSGKNTSVRVADDASSPSSLRVVVETDLEIRSDDFQLHIDALIKSFRKPIGIVVESLTLNGRLQLLVTFSREVSFPHIARVQASFTERPTILFNMMLRGMNVMDVPLLRTVVHSMLVDAIAKTMVDPGRLGLLNRFSKMKREGADAACRPMGSTPRLSAIGVVSVAIRILDSPTLRDNCICVVKLAEQKALLTFTEVDDEEPLVISTDDELEKRAFSRNESLYDSAPVRRARGAGPDSETGLCTSLLVRNVDTDRLRLRLKHAKTATSSHRLTPVQFGLLTGWDVRLGDYLNRLDQAATSRFELTKETKHLGPVRIAVELNYSPLASLNEALVLTACNFLDENNSTGKSDTQQHAHTISDVVNVAAVRNAVGAGKTAGALFVVIHSAADLLALDRNGTSDPYCVVSVNNRKVRTTPFHPRTCAPQFDYAFELLVDDFRRAEIRFELFDYDGEESSQKTKQKRSAADDRLGTVRVDCSAADPVAVRRVLPLSFPLESEQDELDDSLLAVAAPRRTYQAGALFSRPSPSSASLQDAPKLGTLTFSYVFRPADSLAAFYAQPAANADEEDEIVSHVAGRVGDQHPPASQKQSQSSSHSHHRPKHDQMNITDMLRRGHGVMEVRVVEARQLIAKDLNGRSDPFCVLRIGDETVFKTKTRHATLSPYWNETVTSRLPLAGETLELTVYDKDTFGKDFLGTRSFAREEIRVAAKPAQGPDAAKVWYPLRGVSHGEICVAFRVIFDPQGHNEEKGVDEMDQVADKSPTGPADHSNPPRPPRRVSSAVAADEPISFNPTKLDITVESKIKVDESRPTRPPLRSRDGAGAHRPDSLTSAVAAGSVSSDNGSPPPPIPTRVNSRVTAAAPSNSFNESDSSEAAAATRTPGTAIRSSQSHDSQLQKRGELRKVSMSADEAATATSPTDPQLVRNVQKASPAGFCYSRLKGRLLAVRGLNYRHFLSSKEREKAAYNERSSITSGAEYDRLVGVLHGASVSMKLKLENKPLDSEDPGSFGLRSVHESLTVIRSQTIRFAQICSDLARPFDLSTEQREVQIDAEFDIPSSLSSSSRTTAYPATWWLTAAMKGRKQQPIATKSYQLSWLFAASDDVEPTWLKLEDEIYVLFSISATRIGAAVGQTDPQHSPSSVPRHRSVKQSFKELFANNKEHRE